MPLKYKQDVLDKLKSVGYTTYRLRKEGHLSESTIQKLRNGVGVSWDNLETICYLMRCRIEDIIEYEFSENDVKTKPSKVVTVNANTVQDQCPKSDEG